MSLSEQDLLAAFDDLDARDLKHFIKAGWLRPLHGETAACYSEIDQARLQLILHLRQDIEANDAAVPVVLSLLDQLHGLRHLLKAMGRAVDAQEAGVRAAILDNLKQEFRRES